jgi:hypothetical protein
LSTETVGAGASFWGRPWTVPGLLFALLVPLYAANAGPHPVSDPLVNMYLPVQVLAGGGITFSPLESPFMFVWEFEEPYRTRWELIPPFGPKPVYFGSWDDEILGRKTGELLKEGALRVREPLYYLSPSATKDRFASIYGPGPGLAAVPYFAALAVVKRDWRENSAILWTETRIFAAACVAGSAVFVYLALLLHLGRGPAIGLSLLYALGTCVWCEPSQALWQQTPTLLFLSMGLYGLLRLPESARMAAAAGLGLGLATLCRPPVGVLLVTTAAVVLRTEKKARLPFLLGCAGPLLLLAILNAVSFGSPFRFGQVLAGKSLSEDGNVYQQASLLEGAAGLLISPSRGLLVFTPFFAFSLWGAVACWRTLSPSPAALRAGGLAFVVAFVLAAKWFAWYGGWCFGYRRLIEWAPLLMLLLIPVAKRILERPALRAAFGICAVVSFAIQALGAYGYDMAAWNGAVGIQAGGRVILPRSEEEAKAAEALDGARPVVMDVDDPAFQSRLWSWGDGQIAYMIGRKDVLAQCAAAKAAALERARLQKWGGP